MLLDLVSDFHHGHHQTPNFDWQNAKNPGSRILTLDGDTANSFNETLKVIGKARQWYEHVLVTDGNHEYYHSRADNITDALEWSKWFEQEIKYNGWNNVHYLNGENTFFLDGILFIGCMGWYDWVFGAGSREDQHQAWKTGMNDAKIRFASGFYPDKWARLQAEQLKQHVIKAQDDPSIIEIVVMTHTSPTKKPLIVQPYDFEWNKLNGSYGNSGMQAVMDADVNHKIIFWQYGHTHYNNDFFEGHVRMINCARGYPGEKNNWKRPLQIDTATRQKSAFGEIEGL